MTVEGGDDETRDERDAVGEGLSPEDRNALVGGNHGELALEGVDEGAAEEEGELASDLARRWRVGQLHRASRSLTPYTLLELTRRRIERR